MATRTVSVKVAITGEQEYRQKIADISRQMKVLRSEMKVADSAFAGNRDSMEAAAAKGKILEKQYRVQTEVLKANREALENARRAQQEHAAAVDAARKRLEEAEKALKDYREAGGTSEEQLKKLGQAVKEARQDLDQAEGSLRAATKGVADWEVSANNAEATLKSLEHSLEDTGEAAESLGKKGTDAMEAVAMEMVAQGIQSKVKDVADALRDCVAAAIEWESAFTGVEKTVDGTEQEIEGLRREIQEMSTRLPYSTTEIAAIAEIAGQLGIKVMDIASFTETVLELGSATSITAEDAATMLAQYANVTRLDASKYGNIGATIVALGNNFATTESKIVDMSQRIAATATQAGISAPEIMGISAAISSVGIEAEAGGTAFSKLISNVQMAVETGKGLEDYAKVAGVTADAFKQKWGEDAVGAIQLFIKGLSDTERNGKSAVAVLSDMGIKETRLTNTILSLSQASDVMTDAVDMANIAFEENTALTEEAGKRYATTESKIQLLKNSASLLRIEIGSQLKPALDKLAGTGADLLSKVTDYVKKNPQMVKAVTALVTIVGTLTAALAGYIAITKVAALAQTALNEAMAANPVGLVAVAVGAAAVAIAGLVVAFQEAEEGARDFGVEAYSTADAIREISAAQEESLAQTEATADLAESYLEKLDRLNAQSELTNTQQMEYRAIVEKLNALIPELGLEIDEQTGKLKTNTEEVRNSIAAWKDKAKQEAYQQAYTEVLEKQAKVELEVATNTAKRREVYQEMLEHQKASAEAEEELTQIHRQYTDEQISMNAELAEKVKKLEETRLAEQAAADKSMQTYGEYTEAIEEGEKSMDALAEELGYVGQAYGELTGEVDGATDRMVDASDKSGEMGRNAKKSIRAYINGVEYVFPDLDTAMQAIGGTLKYMKQYEAAYTDGENTVQGYINGAKSKGVALKGVFASLATNARTGWKKALVQSSPSKLTEADARDTVRGYEIGAKKQEESLKKTMGEIGKAGVASYNEAAEKMQQAALRSEGIHIRQKLQTTAEQVVTVKQDETAERRQGKIESLLDTYLPRLAGMKVVTETGTLLGALIPGIDEHFAEEERKAERGQ